MPYSAAEVSSYILHLNHSFRHWTGRDLVAPAATQEISETLYHAPFVVVSHNLLADPVFCYANRTAQELWKMDWDAFMQLPSRLSAEPDARQERERLLQTATRQGYVDNYKGIRVTSDGKRFKIDGCILWNVMDNDGVKLGQAATFDRWEWL